jgi:phosphoglycolate phosphatase
MTPVSVVLFDLDGTISDSARSILTALRAAFAELGIPPLSAEDERTILGPPFYEVLPPYIGATDVHDVIAAYRAHYVGEAGMFDTEVFPGVGELITTLAATGRRLALATSKPEIYAAQILEHLGLAGYFDVVGGDTPDGARSSKALVIEDVLRRLGSPAPGDVLMIGDRRHDVLGARMHGIDTIAVRWGYAPAGELEEARPLAIVDSAAELATLLGVEAAA